MRFPSDPGDIETSNVMSSGKIEKHKSFFTKLKEMGASFLNKVSLKYKKAKVKESPNNDYQLKHIDLNPYSSHPEKLDKYNYTYLTPHHTNEEHERKTLLEKHPEGKLSENGHFITLPYHVDEKGEKAPLPSELRTGKIYHPGETVEHKGKDYSVMSHIHPDPKLRSENIYAKDKSGNVVALPRKEVKHKGLDFSNVASVTLDTGEKKFLHQLTKGDSIISKFGTKHKVEWSSSTGLFTSYRSVGESNRGLYLHSTKDFDKPFLFNAYDKNKQAEVGDYVKFKHMGSGKEREVLDLTKEEHPIVRINRTDDPVIITDYEFTGQRAPEKAYKNDKSKGHISNESFKGEEPEERKRIISQEVRDAVWRRAKGKCENCGSQINLEFDHIIPFSKGGSSSYRNVQLLCEKCNRKKSDKIG